MLGLLVEALGEKLSHGGAVAMPQGGCVGHPRVSACSAHRGEARFIMPAAAWSHICPELQHRHPHVLAGTATARRRPAQKNLKHLGNACDKRRSPPESRSWGGGEPPLPSQTSC